jgi:hypothetical protein
MGALSSNVQTLLLVSGLLAVGFAGAVWVRAWARGSLKDDPTLLQMFLATFPAILISFLALSHLQGIPRGLTIVAAVAFPFAVSLAERKPVASSAFARIYALAFVISLALWGLYELLVWLGVDMERNPYRKQPS